MFKQTAFAVLAVGMLAGCTTAGDPALETAAVGAAGGAIAGGLIGGDVRAAAAGAAIGGAGGYIVGRANNNSNSCVYEDRRGRQYTAECPRNYR